MSPRHLAGVWGGALIVALGDVSGKGVPAALYSAAIGEMVRGRTFRRRLEKKSSTPAEVLAGMNRILHERNLEEYYCTLCYAMFEFKKHQVTFANSGLPFPVRYSNGRAEQIQMPGGMMFPSRSTFCRRFIENDGCLSA